MGLDDELDLDGRAQGQGDAADGGPGVLAAFAEDALWFSSRRETSVGPTRAEGLVETTTPPFRTALC